MSEASNYTGGSDYTAHTGSPVARTSRPSKKVHNFGKRSNSIKRNPNAPVVKSGWLYKQDSTGMKLWKKRWFVLSDMCLFYYRDDKEEGILGSILLPSFHISMLSVDDHISRKYAFKATHPNMRTYYFCTDTAKDMESWMKVMTDAALVHTEPVRRLEKLKLDQLRPQEMNNVLKHRLLMRPEAHHNERNREADWPEERRQRDAERYGFQKDRPERPLTKINSVKLQPTQASQQRAPQVNGSGDRAGDCSSGELGDGPAQRGCGQDPHQEPQRALQRTNSMQQLEQWVRTQRGRSHEEETRSIMSYQTLPRNMPSYRAPVAPHYPEGYRTLPRNSAARPDSVCSISASLYDRTLGPPAADKRRSMRDDTMWQLYEWQQRQAYGRQAPAGPYGTLPSPRTMVNLSEHAAPSIPPSPSHGSLAVYQSYSPLRSYNVGSRSEVSSPIFRAHLTKYAYPADRRSASAGVHVQAITSQSLQGKTPEELTLLLIKLRRQQAELTSVREHTLTQLMQLGLDGAGPKMNPEDYGENSFIYRPEEFDIDAKLSRLCEQDKVLRTQEEKLQQLHREKHTLETALLSASQEIEMSADNPAAVQGVVQQRDVLQSGLLSTCRELSRVTAELERSWREYDRLETDVSLAKSRLLEQLEALGSQQADPPSQQHGQIQKELWRIQDVMEALSKSKPQRSVDSTGFPGSKSVSSKYKSEGPDYRLYKSEPELTTVAEVDETNGEEKSEQVVEAEPASVKGVPYPVGIVSPRTKSPMPESSTIASYVTLRKSKKPEPKVDRPQSAVEQPGVVECSRPRMSLEEQLERIRRHQQALLRDKKKGVPGQENSPPSHAPPPTLQGRRKEELVCSDILQLEASLREQDLMKEHESPAEEIARLREAETPEDCDTSRELSELDSPPILEHHAESGPEEVLSPEEEADRQKKVDRIKMLIAKNSLQNALPPVTLTPEDEMEAETCVLEQEKMINISYELAAEASKRSKLVAVQALASGKTYM